MERFTEGSNSKAQDLSVETPSETAPKDWTDHMRAPARALEVPQAAAVGVLQEWPSAADMAWKAAHATGYQPGDAAAQAPGGLFWMDGQPPPVALAAAKQHGVSIEQAIALGRTYDEYWAGADLHAALLTIGYWAEKAGQEALKGRGADDAINLLGNFIGEFDPQIMHTELTFRSAKLVTKLLGDFMNRIEEVFGKNVDPCLEIRDAMRSFAMGSTHHLGRPFAKYRESSAAVQATEPSRSLADLDPNALGF